MKHVPAGLWARMTRPVAAVAAAALVVGWVVPPIHAVLDHGRPPACDACAEAGPAVECAGCESPAHHHHAAGHDLAHCSTCAKAGAAACAAPACDAVVAGLSDGAARLRSVPVPVRFLLASTSPRGPPLG